MAIIGELFQLMKIAEGAKQMLLMSIIELMKSFCQLLMPA
jgi:hypothetical protein